MARLPEGYELVIDADGDAWLRPPVGVTIYSEAGEGWLITADYMQGRDWCVKADLEAACCDYLRHIGIEQHGFRRKDD